MFDTAVLLSAAFVAGAARHLAPGGLLKVIATDPSTRRDIPKFCMFLGHELIEQSESKGTYLYWIRKKAE